MVVTYSSPMGPNGARYLRILWFKAKLIGANQVDLIAFELDNSTPPGRTSWTVGTVAAGN